MESMTSIPNKRLCTKPGINNMQLIECRREFPLYQQYPSTVVPGWNKPSTANKINTVIKQHVNNVGRIAIMPKTLKSIPGQEANLLSNIKKLRIKSKDGRDLGEMNVQFLPRQDNTLHGKTITVTKPSFINTLNKPVKISIFPNERNGKILSASCVKKKGLEAVKFPVACTQIVPGQSKSEVETRCISTVQRPHVTVEAKQLKHCKVCENSILQKKKIIDTQVNNEVAKIQTSTNSAVKCVKVLKETLTPVSLENNSILGSLDQSNNGRTKERLVIRCRENINEALHSRKEPSANADWYQQIAQSKFPIVKCERLCMPAHKDFLMKRKLGEKKQDDDNQVESVIYKKIKTEIIAEENDETQSQVAESLQSISTVSVHNPKTVILEQNDKIQKSPIMLIKDKSVLKQTQKEPESENNTALSTEAERNALLSIKLEDSKIQVEDLIISPLSTTAIDTSRSKTNTQSRGTHSTNPPPPEKLSDSWNIIQKALSSVTDDELRNKALQALAACGIGIERRVPIPPPEQLRSVHDTQTQTEIFSLLEKENFVLVRKELPNLQRIKQPTIAVLNFPRNSSTQAARNQSNLITCDNLILGLTAPFSSSKSLKSSTEPDISQKDIDEILESLCKDNEEVSKVQKALLSTNSARERIMLQLKQDFESKTQWDEEGLLNIHRAVINGNAQDVERYILVLKACKESVDLMTSTGETSLELAIKYNASPAIVKILLQAGAQPVLPKPVRDSAVILASKMSSPLLPELLKYVTNKKLLDQVNADGFAAIHYCVLNNNCGNVTALIQAGANVDLRDKRSGRTPFFHAVQNSYNGLAQKLLDAGATINLPNFSGQTVLMFVDDVSSVSLKAALSKQMNASQNGSYGECGPRT